MSIPVGVLYSISSIHEMAEMYQEVLKHEQSIPHSVLVEPYRNVLDIYRYAERISASGHTHKEKIEIMHSVLARLRLKHIEETEANAPFINMLYVQSAMNFFAVAEMQGYFPDMEYEQAYEQEGV